MIFHVSNLNTKVLHPLTYSHQLDTNCGKIRYVFEWPLKRNRPSFCLIKTFFHALNGLFSVLSRLHGCKYKCAFCLMKYHWMWLLSDIVAWDSFWHGTHYLFPDIDAVPATFQVLVNNFLNFRLALLVLYWGLLFI